MRAVKAAAINRPGRTYLATGFRLRMGIFSRKSMLKVKSGAIGAGPWAVPALALLRMG
jgi:hypothetical protein